jgi:hypothetical protein
VARGGIDPRHVLATHEGLSYYENGLKGHGKTAQGIAGESQEPKATADRDALGLRFRNTDQLPDQARAGSPRLIGE